MIDNIHMLDPSTVPVMECFWPAVIAAVGSIVGGLIGSKSKKSSNNSSNDWKSSLINTGLSLGANYLNQYNANQYNSKNMKQQYNYNLGLMSAQAALNRDQFGYEYAMESPRNRLMQLRQAGLNPSILNSAGLSTMQGAVGTVSPSGVTIPTAPSMLDINQSLLARASMDDTYGNTAPQQTDMSLKETQMIVNKQSAKLAEQDIISRKLENRIQKVNAEVTEKYGHSMAEEEYKSLVYENEKIIEELIALKNENSLFPQRKQELENQIRLQAYQRLLMEAETELKKVQARLADANTTLTKYQKSRLEALLPGELLSQANQLSIDDITLAVGEAEKEQAKYAEENKEVTYWADVVSTTINKVLVGVGIGAGASRLFSSGRNIVKGFSK